MKKFVPAVALSLAGMVVFTACGPESGTVYAKQFTPGHYTTEQVADYIPICQYDPNLKMTTCRQQFIGYHDSQRWHDDCYALFFKNDEGDKGDDCVPQSTYDSTDIGDFYSKE